MAKKNKKKGLQKALIMDPTNKGKFKIGEWELGFITQLKDGISNWNEVENHYAMVIITCYILAQIRTYNLGVPPQEIDSTESVKFYKQIITQSMSARTFLATLAVGLTLDFVDIADPSAIEATISQLTVGFKGNLKMLSSPTVHNIYLYRLGVMSRAMGLLQACPITSMGMLGIEQRKVQDQGLDEILKQLGFGNKEEVIKNFQEQVGTGKTFKEGKLATPVDQNGLTKLEIEIFGEKIQRSQPVALKVAVGTGGMIQPGTINTKILNQYLTPLQLAQYNSAVANGNQNVVISLTKIAKEKYENDISLGQTKAAVAPKTVPLSVILNNSPIKRSNKKEEIWKALIELEPEVESAINYNKSNKEALYQAFLVLSTEGSDKEDLFTIDGITWLDDDKA